MLKQPEHWELAGIITHSNVTQSNWDYIYGERMSTLRYWIDAVMTH